MLLVFDACLCVPARHKSHEICKHETKLIIAAKITINVQSLNTHLVLIDFTREHPVTFFSYGGNKIIHRMLMILQFDN